MLQRSEGEEDAADPVDFANVFNDQALIDLRLEINLSVVRHFVLARGKEGFETWL